jgi:hypothetical protein
VRLYIFQHDDTLLGFLPFASQSATKVVRMMSEEGLVDVVFGVIRPYLDNHSVAFEKGPGGFD